MKKILIINFLILFLSVQNLFSQNCQIRVIDTNEFEVEFILESDSNLVFLSNSNGVLEIDSSTLIKFGAEKLNFHFKDRMAYLLYKTRLYFSSKKQSPYYKTGEITLEKLCKHHINIYFLRQKKLRFD